MEAAVTSPFTDRKSGHVYLAGDTYTGSAERIRELAEKGLVEKPAPKPAAKRPKKT